MPVKRKTVGSGITKRKRLVFSGSLTVKEKDQLIARLGDPSVRRSPIDFLGGLEAGIRAILDQEGLEGDIPVNWFVESPLLRQVKGQERDTRGWYAVEMLGELRLLQYHQKIQDADTMARHAFELGHLLAEAQIKFKWEGLAMKGQKELKVQDTNLRKGRKKQSEAAQKRWEPWKSRFEELRPKCSSDNEALEIVMDEMAELVEQIPSKNTLKIQFGLMVDWPRFRLHYQKFASNGEAPKKAINKVRRMFKKKGLKMPTYQQALAKLFIPEDF